MDFNLFSLSIRAKDVKKLAAFYKETFGLKTQQESAALSVLELNNGVLLVFQKIGFAAEKVKAGPDKTPLPPGPSRYGIVFEVDDIDAAYKQLKSKLGLTTPPTKEDWGARTLSGHDPEGNRIDLIQRTKTAAAR